MQTENPQLSAHGGAPLDPAESDLRRVLHSDTVGQCGSGVFEKAIESKVTAEQDALKAKNRTVQIEEEAKQKIISAEAEAKSMAIRANALTRNKALVEYEAVQKWDGKLPQYMLGNTVPFLNLK